jgi:hypothetical protein
VRFLEFFAAQIRNPHTRRDQNDCQKFARFQSEHPFLEEVCMDTIHQQHKQACEEALRLYASIEAAIEDRRTGFAKEASKNLRALLKNSGSRVFEDAAPYLPQVTPNLGEWRAEVAYSKSKIEDYLVQLEHMP